MPLLALSPRDQNVALLDPWSAVHLAAGLALGLVGVSVPVATGIAVAYEGAEYAAENSSEQVRRLFRVSGPETLTNQIVDIALLALGAELGRRWRG